MAESPSRERCFVLWLFYYWPYADGAREADRVVACQLERGHRGEHESKTEVGNVWWNKESQCTR
jgi:hypothetical protein